MRASSGRSATSAGTTTRIGSTGRDRSSIVARAARTRAGAAATQSRCEAARRSAASLVAPRSLSPGAVASATPVHQARRSSRDARSGVTDPAGSRRSCASRREPPRSATRCSSRVRRGRSSNAEASSRSRPATWATSRSGRRDSCSPGCRRSRRSHAVSTSPSRATSAPVEAGRCAQPEPSEISCQSRRCAAAEDSSWCSCRSSTSTPGRTRRRARRCSRHRCGAARVYPVVCRNSSSPVAATRSRTGTSKTSDTNRSRVVCNPMKRRCRSATSATVVARTVPVPAARSAEADTTSATSPSRSRLARPMASCAP